MFLVSPLFQQQSPANFYSLDDYNLVNQTSSIYTFAKQTPIKLLNLPNLTCMNMIEPQIHQLLFNLNSSNSFCSYRKFCPSTCSCCSSKNNCNCSIYCPNECSCKHSYDLKNNYLNCSYRQLNSIPLNIPYSTTHLLLNNNHIKLINNSFKYLTKLKYLSLSNNNLEYLSKDLFSQINEIEYLDLSSNYIEYIQSRTFSNMFYLRQLYLHDNLWIPKFYTKDHEFQSNKYLKILTYGNGFLCNRSFTFIERLVATDDCCHYSTNKSCPEIKIKMKKNELNNRINSTLFENFLTFNFHQKSILIISILFLLVLICIFILYIHRKKCIFIIKQKYLFNNNNNNTIRKECNAKGKNQTIHRWAKA